MKTCRPDRRPGRWAMSPPLAALLLLGGCAGHPVRTPVTSLPPAFEASYPGIEGEQAPDRWWDLFGDPQLTHLIETALISAPDARRAVAVLAQAQAERRRALSDYDPQGSLSASATRQHATISGLGAAGAGGALPTTIGGTTTTYNLGFSPSWELDLFGRRAAAATAANADLEAARFDHDAARQSLSAAVAANLFEARGLAVQRDQARETSRIAHEFAAIGAQRAAAGIGSRADAAALAADAASSDADVVSLDSALAVSRRSLLVLIGRGGDRLETLAIDARLGPPPRLPRTAPADLLARRPDVRATEARLRSAIGTLKLDRLALLPTINLLPGASKTDIKGAAGYGTSIWSIAAGLTLPILDRRRLLAGIQVQDARVEQAVIAYEAAVQGAYGEAESRLTTLAADQTRLGQLAEAETQARAAFDAQSLGYRAGIVDLTTLLTSERTWRASLNVLNALKATALRDAVDTIKALGGGWTPHDDTRTVAEARP